ncbi:MAG: DUF1573 domain-containing protein [Bacteroidia bacterium]|nr:DUF1573 domain-containing protein [Bacteroidia bacterium]
MKKVFISTLVLMAIACGNNESSKQAGTEIVTNTASAENPTEENKNATEITFEKNIYDFGTIKEGDLVNYKFKFTNTGKNPLLITNASASCGCTVPNWPKEPIAPGKSGEIDVTFNSEGKPNHAEKTVTIVANTTPTNTMLLIKGEVTPKPGSTSTGSAH